MKKKEIVIVVLLMIFGFIYNAVQKNKIKFIDDFSGYLNERRLIGTHYAEYPQKGMVFPAPDKIAIDNPAGEIIIDKSTDGQVHLLTSFRVYYEDKADVEKISQNARFHAEINENTLNISGDYGSAFPYKRLRIRFELLVPEGVMLSVLNHEGTISIRRSGKDIYVKQENGNVFLEDNPSSAQIEIRGGNLDVKNIAGNVTIDAMQGDILLQNASALHLKGRHGNYVLNKIKANAYIEHAYGDVSLDGAGQAEIFGRHSKLAVRNIENGLTLSNAFDGIFIENVKGDVQLDGRSSKMEIRHVNAKDMVIENSFADIVIADCAGENLNVRLKNGNLDFLGTTIADRLNIEARQADITLSLGALSDPTFNIKTISGRIFNQSSIALDIFQEKDESYANRSGQKPEIIINDNYGDIYIK
jgi:hypothetical protein